MTEPERWDRTVPGLMKLWSASSLRLLMECPRKYWYRYVRGVTVQQPMEHMEFGRFMHRGLQTYAEAVLERGLEHDAAVLEAVKVAMQEAGDVRWEYRCAECGETFACPVPWPVKTEEGNCPKCRIPFLEQRPERIERWVAWDSDHKKKNRKGLFRALVWVLDAFKDSNIRPYAWSDGTAAVEDRFIAKLSKVTPDGDNFVLQGYTDRFGRFGDDGKIVPIETKTTSSTLGQGFFGRYEFDVQIDVYALVLRMMNAPELIFPGVAVEGIQIAQEFVRARREIVTPGSDQLDEFLETVVWWLGEAERYAREAYWPMNRSNCNNFRKEDAAEGVGTGENAHGGCPYRGICTKARSVREMYMKV